MWLALHKPRGQFGYWLFAFLGLFAGLLISWAFLRSRILWLFPFPICQQGRCTKMGQDYVWRLGTLYGYEQNGLYLYKCRCGDFYLREGKRFMRLLEGDTLSPYKRLVAFRKWADDSDPLQPRSK